jgi:sugar phosphate isomerase/epimerase
MKRPALGFLALFLCASPLFAEPAHRPPAPLFAFCMDTHDAKKRTLAEQAELLQSLGYAGAGHLWLDKVDERIKTLDAAGLRLFQIYLRVDVSASAKAGYDARLQDVVPLLKGRDVTLALLLQGRKPRDPDGEARAVELVREIADLAKPAGVRVALYPHTGDWMERVQDALRVAEKADRPDVGLMFNLCHWMKTTPDEGELKDLLAKTMPRLVAVSLSGSDAVAEVKSGKGNWIQPLDGGTYDVGGFLKTLRELGYKGPVGLQCYGIGGDARDHLARSMAAWRKMHGRPAAQGEIPGPVTQGTYKAAFDEDPVGALSKGWQAGATNPGGDLAGWKVVADDKAPSRPHVLSIVSIADRSGQVFNLCWTRDVSFKDGSVSVRVRANAGELDQGGGPVWRVRDANNYYIARYNPLEKNFRLYCVKDGVRRQLADAGGLSIPAGEWFVVKAAQKGDAIACELNGRKLLEATDATLPGAGGVGVWTKADAASSFDDVEVVPE